MRILSLLFLFFIISSSLSFAVSQSDIDAINRINYRESILIDDNTVLNEDIILGDNIIYTPSSSLNEEVISKSNNVKGVIYGENAILEVENSNIDFENVGIGKGIIAVAGDNITGNFTVTFFTNMPNTPFSIKHYDGITDNKTLAQLDGETIIPLIYSDEYGTVTYSDNRFSTQILSFPSPLTHKAGGDYTNYYLDYFFSSYDFVTFREAGVFNINDSWSNYSKYETYTPTYAYVEYSDSMIDVMFQGASKRLKLISKNYTAGFTKTVTVKAANNINHAGEVSQSFTWKLNATTASQYPRQIAYIPNQSINLNSRQTFYFNNYFNNYSGVCLVFYNISNYSQTGSGFNQGICADITLYSYGNITNSSIFLVDLNGLGSDIAEGFYTNNTGNITVAMLYTAYKYNSTNGTNMLNGTMVFLTINGTPPNCSNSTSTLINYTTYSSYSQGPAGDASPAGIIWLSNTSGNITKIIKPSSDNAAMCRVFDNTTLEYVGGANGTFDNTSKVCTHRFEIIAGHTYYIFGYGGTFKYNSSSVIITNIGNFSNGVYCNANPCTGYYFDTNFRHIIGFEFEQGSTIACYASPQQTSSLSDININYDDQVYLEYNDYFIGFDNINISFTSTNGTNLSLNASLNSSSSKLNISPYFILNLSGNGFVERLYITAGVNSSYTLFNISICNHDTCLNVSQYLNISAYIPTSPPIQTYHIDNIFMNLSDIFTVNWGAYFFGYSGISISFIDLITNESVSIIYYNSTVNYTKPYLNITSFLNVVNVNTTFQSFNTSYYTVMLVEAFNAYGSTGQYINFNINYTYVPPPIVNNETCINKSVICLFPDYTTLNRRQMNTYIILSILVTLVLLGFAAYKIFGEIGIISVIIGVIVVVIELIYFGKILYLPVSYIVGISFTLIVVIYSLYKWVTR